MATIVNLNLGSSVAPEPTTYELVLANGYTEPSPYLLVLRSQESVDGGLVVTGANDAAVVEGTTGIGIEPVSGVLSVIMDADTALVEGTVIPRATDGDLLVTEDRDAVAVVGTHEIDARIATLSVIEDPDEWGSTNTYTPKWVATAEATEATDQGVFNGAFSAYSGPGFIGVTERRSTATFVGRITYPVASTSAAIIEAHDTAAIEVRTPQADVAALSDTVLVSDTLTGRPTYKLSDILYVTDDLDESSAVAVTDIGYVSDALSSHFRLSGALTDTLAATDTLKAILHGNVSDTLAISETLISIASGALADTVIAGETLTGNLDTSGALADTVIAVDALIGTYWGAIEDTVLVSDGATGQEHTFAALADTLTVADELTGAYTIYGALDDTGVLTDGLTGALALVGVLSDTVLIGDALAQAAETLTVVNAETGAVSTYVLTPTIKGLTQFRGVLYLAGPDGLYALDADQDEDGAVVWTLRTGFSNLGTDRLKRVQDANFQARTEGDTTFQVVSDRYGQKQEWNYRLPPLTRDSYRDGVVKPGKGIQSVYWQFAAQGIGPAEIDQIRLVVEPLSRRR